MDIEKQLILTFAKDIAVGRMAARGSGHLDTVFEDFKECIPKVKKIFDKIDWDEEDIFESPQ